MQSPFGEHGGLGAATYDYSSFMTGADGAPALGVAPGSSAGTRAAAPGRRFDGGEITPPSGSVAAMPHLSYDKGEEWGSGDASLSHTPLSGATDTPESGSGSPPSSGAVTKATIAKAKASGCNLICNYLPASLTESELRQMMLTCGAVLRCKIVLNKRTRHSAGYGFVLFSDYESATNAIQKFDGMPLRGKRLKVARARPQDPQRQRANLFVAGIHPILDNTDLHALFASFGDIIECKVLFDKTTRRSRSVGFVRYHFRADACAAIENLSGRETRLPASILSRHLNPTGGYLLPETILLQIKFADGSSYPKRGNGGTSSSSTGSASPSPRGGRDPAAYAPQTYGAPVMAPQAPAYGGMPPGGFYSMGPMAPPVPAAGRGGPAGAPGGEAVPTWGDHGLPMQGFNSRGMHYTMPVAMGPGGQMAPYAVPYSNSGSMAFASQMAALSIHDSRSAGHPAAPMYAPQAYAMAPAADATAAPSHMRAAASGPASLPAQPLFVGATAGPTSSVTAAAASATPAAATSTVATSSAAADGPAASAAPTTAATEPASSAGGEEPGADPFGASLGFSGLGPNLIPTLPSIPQLPGGQPQPSSLYYFPSDAGSTPGLTGYPMAYGSMPAGYTSGMAPMASAADLALDAEESSGSTRLSKWASAATE